ncbi:MAG: hypothetical protein ACTS46_01215 [Candidatus Hodgkinia cicadicola]
MRATSDRKVGRQPFRLKLEVWKRNANGPLEVRIARTIESVVSFEGGETARFQFNGS